MAVSAARRNFEEFYGICTKKGLPGGEKSNNPRRNRSIAGSYIPLLGQMAYCLYLHEIRTGKAELTKGEKAALVIRSICVISVVGLIPLFGLDLIGTIMVHSHKRKLLAVPVQDPALDEAGQ